MDRLVNIKLPFVKNLLPFVKPFIMNRLCCHKFTLLIPQLSNPIPASIDLLIVLAPKY